MLFIEVFVANGTVGLVFDLWYMDTLADLGSPRERVRHFMKEMLSSGRLVAGQRVPSERQLAKICNVARMTARAALRELESENLIRSNGSSRRIRSSPSSPLMSSTIALLSHEPTTVARKPRVGEEDYVRARAMQTIEQNGFHCLSLGLSLSSRADSLAHLFRERPRGILATYHLANSKVGEALLIGAANADIPVVVYGDAPFVTEHHRVVSDHYRGAADLVHWFAARGRKRILRVWSKPKEEHWLQQRSLGAESALRELGLEVLPEVCLPPSPLSPDPAVNFPHQVRLMLGYLLEHLRTSNPPDAIMAMDDTEAGAVATACSHYGINPTEDVLISGYDNTWAGNPVLSLTQGGPVVTVDKNNGLVGEELARLIIEVSSEKFQSAPRENPERRVVPHQLVELLSSSIIPERSPVEAV